MAMDSWPGWATVDLTGMSRPFGCWRHFPTSALWIHVLRQPTGHRLGKRRQRVTGSGVDGQLLMVDLCDDLDGSDVVGGAVDVGIRQVTDCVSAANLLRDFVESGTDVVEVGGHIELAAADTGNLPQDTRIAVAILAIEQTDRIDGDPRRLDDVHQVGERYLAFVIASVADHDERALIAGAQLDVVQGCGGRVVESGSAGWDAAIQGLSQKLNVIRERDALGEARNYVVVEVDVEELVVRITLFGKRKSGGGDVSTLGPHASAIVDH